MRKIRLEVESLSVESFVAADAPRSPAGTVNGNMATKNCPSATAMTFCQTNCDCTLGCPTLIAICTA